MYALKIYDDFFVCKANDIGKVIFSSHKKMHCSILDACLWHCRWSCWWLNADERVHMPRINVQVLQSSGLFIWCRIFERIKCCRHNPFVVNQRIKRFSGMLDNIDCMHRERKNYLSDWQGQYKRHVGECRVIFEALASHDLCIWWSFFCMFPQWHQHLLALSNVL
jgi:hypothetical protein